MRASCCIALLLVSAATACSQTVYYATFSGENYARKTWHSSSLAAFKAARPDDVYDSYTVERRRDATVVVHRDYTTPSGDWRFELTYEYGRDRRLRKLHSEFVTFGGITISGKDEGLTRCVRTFTVSRAGTLHKTSERITDAKSGRVVAQQFFEPQIEHWMSLDELPIYPKT
jgi:hypothetical protein